MHAIIHYPASTNQYNCALAAMLKEHNGYYAHPAGRFGNNYGMHLKGTFTSHSDRWHRPGWDGRHSHNETKAAERLYNEQSERFLRALFHNTRPMTSAFYWRSSANNVILCRWMDDHYRDCMEVQVYGRRHGIPWCFLKTANIAIEEGHVHALSSHAPDCPPWEAGVEQEADAPRCPGSEFCDWADWSIPSVPAPPPLVG